MSYDGSLKFDTRLDESGFSNGLNKLGSVALTSVAAIGTSLAAASTYAIKVGADFEEGMSKVQAISGATEVDIQKLTEKAKEMGAKTKFSATEASEAMQYMAMAGWKASDMVSGIDGIMNLAAASGEELASVSDIVTDALTAFGLQAQDSAHFADVLAKASSNSNTNVGMMGATFKYAAPLAGALKYSIEDVAVATGLMANAGIKGEQAGTALRSMFTRLAKPPKECAGAMDALNLSITNADGTAKPLNQTIKEMREKFGKLSDTQKTQYAASIAGQEAMSGLLAIVNASDSDFNKLTKAISRSDGAAEDMAKTMQNNLKGKITILGSSLEGLGIQAYEKFEKPMKEAVDGSIKKVEGLSREMSSGNLSKSMDKCADGLSTVAEKALELAADAIPVLVNGFAMVVDHGGEIVTVAGLIGSAIVGIRVTEYVMPMVEAFKGASAAVEAYNVMLVASTAAGQTFNGTLTLGQAAIGLITGQTTLATAATIAWDTACAAFGGSIGVIIGAVATVSAGVALYCFAMDDEINHYKQVNDKITEQAAAFDDIKAKQEEKLDADLSEIDHSKRLADELSKLSDANGKVKKGYETRANFILGELNDALGTEYKMVDGTIQKYGEFKKSITDLIAVQRAQIILESEKEAYTEAIKNQTQAVIDLNTYEQEYNRVKLENDAKVIELSAERDEAIRRGDEVTFNSCISKINALDEETKQAEANYQNQLGIVDRYNNAIAIYDADAAAVKSGNVAAMSAMNDRYAQSYEVNGERVSMELDKQCTTEKTTLERLQVQRDEALEKANGNQNDYYVKAYDDEIRHHQSLLDEMMLSNGKGLSQYGTYIERRLTKAGELKTGLNKNEKGITKEMVDEAQRQTVESLTEYGEYVNEKNRKAIELKGKLDRNEKGVTKEMVKEAQNQADQASREFQKVSKSVTDAMDDLPEDTRTIFSNMVKPMSEEMEKAKPNLWESAKNIADGILGNLKKAFDIHSPSKRTREIFKNVMLGAEKGLDDETDSILDQTDDLTSELLNKLHISSSDAFDLVSKLRKSAASLQMSMATSANINIKNSRDNAPAEKILKLELTDKRKNETRLILDDGREIAHWLAPSMAEELMYVKG